MRRIQYHRYGGPDVLELDHVGPPVAGPGQLVVRVRAAAANPMDWKIRNGNLQPLTGRTFPRGVGQDFAGVVEAVGPGVNRITVGDDVLGAAPLRTPGSFAELVLADQDFVVTKPLALDFEAAATLPVVGVTALQALNRVGRLLPGQHLFIHGCLGGVGRVAAQLAIHRGARVVGSCRPTTAHLAADMGVHRVVDFDVDPTPLRRRFDLVFDTVGVLPARTARSLVAPGGRIVDIVPSAGKFVRSVLPGPFSVFMGRPDVIDLHELARAAERGEVTLPIARTVPLDQAISALVELETRSTSFGGKLVITPT